MPRRYQKSSTPMAISTCSPPSVKSAADSGQPAEAFALVDHLHWCVASAPRVGSHLRPPLTRTARPRHHGSHRLQGNGCLARQVPPSVLFQSDADRFTRAPQTSGDRRQIAEALPPVDQPDDTAPLLPGNSAGDDVRIVELIEPSSPASPKSGTRHAVPSFDQLSVTFSSPIMSRSEWPCGGNQAHGKLRD